MQARRRVRKRSLQTHVMSCHSLELFPPVTGKKNNTLVLFCLLSASFPTQTFYPTTYEACALEWVLRDLNGMQCNGMNMASCNNTATAKYVSRLQHVPNYLTWSLRALAYNAEPRLALKHGISNIMLHQSTLTLLRSVRVLLSHACIRINTQTHIHKHTNAHTSLGKLKGENKNDFSITHQSAGSSDCSTHLAPEGCDFGRCLQLSCCLGASHSLEGKARQGLACWWPNLRCTDIPQDTGAAWFPHSAPCWERVSWQLNLQMLDCRVALCSDRQGPDKNDQQDKDHHRLFGQLDDGQGQEEAETNSTSKHANLSKWTRYCNINKLELIIRVCEPPSIRLFFSVVNPIDEAMCACLAIRLGRVAPAECTSK